MTHEFVSTVLQATGDEREWRTNARWGTEARGGSCNGQAGQWVYQHSQGDFMYNFYFICRLGYGSILILSFF